MDDKKLDLLELIDKDFLQELQDNFANAMNVASLIYDTEKPVTKPSKFVDFCMKHTRGSAIGAKMCEECDLRWGKIASDRGEPVIYNCHTGLVDFVVPIMVENQHIGSFFGGQILFAPQDENKIREIAKTIGVDENEYIQAMRKVEIVPEENIKAAANLLYIVTNTISEIAHKNLELKRKNKREKLYKDIVAIIRSTLDINKVKEKIVNSLGQALKADRCFIVDYDKKKDTFLIVKDEYLSSENIPEYAGANVNEDVPAFMKEFKKGHYLVVDNKKIFINNEPQEYQTEKETIKRAQVNSAYGFPLFYNNELHGVLGIHYLSKNHIVNKDEIELLLSISAQMALAIHQALLYKKIQEQVKRESLLKNIIDKMRSSLNIEEILSFICKEVAKIFNVQRATIIMVPNINNLGNYLIKNEYKSSPEIKGSNDLIEQDKVFYHLSNSIIIDQKVLMINNMEESDAPDYFKNAYINIGVKSLIGAPIKKGNELWGIITLSDYNDYRHWREEDKELLSIITNQTFIAINQAELYEKEKLSAEREKINRNIIEILRSSIDKVIIKKLFVKNIGKFFNADRVIFSEYDNKLGIYLPIDNDSEYLSSAHEKSYIGFDWSKPDIQFWIKPLLEKKEMKIVNWEEYVNQGHEISDFLLSFYRESNIKSKYGFPIVYQNHLMGFFCLEFTQKACNLSDEDIERIRRICTQAGIALYHANLYQNAQQCSLTEKDFKKNLLGKVEQPAQEIRDISAMLSQNQFEREVELEYLNNIIKSCNQLLELTKEINNC